LTARRRLGADPLDPEVIRSRHALAWAYANHGADGAAADLVAEQRDQLDRMLHDGFLHLGDDLMLYAQNALLAGDVNLSIQRLGAAVAAGWRDYYAFQADPRWQPIRQDPRIKKLMARVKADVAGQRTMLEQSLAREEPDDELDLTIEM